MHTDRNSLVARQCHLNAASPGILPTPSEENKTNAAKVARATEFPLWPTTRKLGTDAIDQERPSGPQSRRQGAWGKGVVAPR
jgi:hypothetical protein